MINNLNQITIYKGDTEKIRFRATQNGVPYILNETEEYYFTVKLTKNEKSPILIQKKIKNPKEDFFDVEITKTDTENMQCGHYVWDLRRKDLLEISTPIVLNDFNLMEAVGNNV